jgi:hypothetical protein
MVRSGYGAAGTVPAHLPDKNIRSALELSDNVPTDQSGKLLLTTASQEREGHVGHR